jgi:hypothetical protein
MKNHVAHRAGMRLSLVIWCFVFAVGSLQAQRNNWKPKDFEPMTRLPWAAMEGKRTQDQVIERIFRETNADIRYRVLGEYLRRIPATDLQRAFDLAVALEGTQTPGKLVSFMLYIWAQRDPVAAWRKTRELFKLVGIPAGWLGYDSWENEQIDVQDWQAIQHSRFWIHQHALLGFAAGCDASDLNAVARVNLLKQFADLWFERFKSWPGDFRRSDYPGVLEFDSYAVIQSFSHTLDSPQGSFGGGDDAQACSEIIWRRWLEAHPDRVTELIQEIERTEFSKVDYPRHRDAEKARISTELLLVWRKADLKGLTAWASTPQSQLHHQAWITAQCMLLAEVSPKLRETWLSTLLQGPDVLENLRTLASWEPQIAMEQAVRVKDQGMELSVLVDGCADGPWGSRVINTTHSGLGYLYQHGLEHLPAPLQKSLMAPGWFESYFMELWGLVDVGEAARFGLRTMLEGNLVPRQELRDMYSGKASGDTDDGIIDRTFCALRVWAVIRPDEVAEWIEKQDKDMRESLRWLLKHSLGKERSSK